MTSCLPESKYLSMGEENQDCSFSLAICRSMGRWLAETEIAESKKRCQWFFFIPSAQLLSVYYPWYFHFNIEIFFLNTRNGFNWEKLHIKNSSLLKLILKYLLWFYILISIDNILIKKVTCLLYVTFYALHKLT